MKNDTTKIALICLLLIAVISMLTSTDGAKEITLTVSGGIVGWLGHSYLSTPSLTEKNTDEKEG